MIEAANRTECAARHDYGAHADVIISVPSPTHMNSPKPATVSRHQRETDAARFIITSTIITAMIFGLINLIVYFSGPAYLADAVVSTPRSPRIAVPYESIVDGSIRE